MTMQAQSHTRYSRRDFLKTSSALAVANSLALPFVAYADNTQDKAASSNNKETIKYSACLVNCGSRCPLKVHVEDGVIKKISSETFVDDSSFGEHQIRPCLRGRSVRWRTYGADRLKYPMKRIGKRGEGKFERITWDEATTILANQLKRVKEQYGNDAIYYQYGSGTTGANLQGRNAGKRLLSLHGGYLDMHGSYSTAQIDSIFPYIYGGAGGWSSNTLTESLLNQIENSDLVVMFCQNLAGTRMSGGGQFYETLKALEKSQAKVIIIDPRRTDSVPTLDAEWVPIVPGTDGALVAGIIHTMIKENLVDEAFLKSHVVGWDESTLPESAPRNGSYKDYILGNGEDETPKTAQWAETITAIPAKRIIQLAREIGNAKAAWISQGWGLQRTSNGEQAARAIMMLPIVSGHIGKPGTNSGGWGGNISYSVPGLAIPNPIKTKIPCFMWTDAIVRGTEMTAENANVKGTDRLHNNIKFLWNYSSNTTMNQHSDLNKTHEILSDESLCEFIVVWDTNFTNTANYADLLLPDASSVEVNDLINNSYASGAYHYATLIENTIEPLWECRPSYDVLVEVAEKLGIKDEFTEGRTLKEWIEHSYNLMRDKNPNLPEFENAVGVVDRKLTTSPEASIAYFDFVRDPLAHPLGTPSGKIEIYSELLAEMGKTWELPEGDKIPAVPEYCPTLEGSHNRNLMRKHPFQMVGYHDKGHVHSTYTSVPMLQEAIPHAAWINPLDAQRFSIKTGDVVEIFNDRGRMSIHAKVTPNVMPGVLAVPQGAWRKQKISDPKQIDMGGCINTLTTQRPSPLAKGPPQHTNLVSIKLMRGA